MDSKVIVLFACLFLLVSIACWLVLNPVFATFDNLQSNFNYRIAVVVIFITPLSLFAFLGLILYAIRRE